MTNIGTILSVPSHGHENRYFRLFCESLERRGLKVIGIRNIKALLFHFDILHVHFPTHFITQTSAPVALLWALALLSYFGIVKLRRKRIVYSVHDVVPVNIRNARILWAYWRLFLGLCDGFVFLSLSSQDEYYRQFPACRTKPAILIPHGPYPSARIEARQRAATRIALRVSETDVLVGILGSIKPYKNIDAIRLLPRVLGDGRQVKVLVAGKIEVGYSEQVTATLAEIPQEHLIRIDRSPSDDELDLLIQSCDICYLPYSKSSNSGAAMLVLSNYMKLLASDLPIFRELERVVPKGWVFTFSVSPSAPCDLRGMLEGVVAAERKTESEAALRQFLGEISFDSSVPALVAFYRCLMHEAHLD